MNEVVLVFNLNEVNGTRIDNEININPLGTLNLKRIKMANGELIATYGKVDKQSPVPFGLATLWCFKVDAWFDTDRIANELKNRLPVADVIITHDVRINSDKTVSAQINVYGHRGEDNGILSENLEAIYKEIINNDTNIKIYA